MIKHLHRFCLLLTACLCFGNSETVFAQTFTENFRYPANAALSENGWLIHSGGTSNPFMTVNNGLEYMRLPGSNDGTAVAFVASGQDVNKAIGTSYNSGSVYVSFLANFSDATTGGDYFIHFSPVSNTSNTTFTGRVFARKTAGGKLQFGVSKVSTPAAEYADTEFELNTTHLVVMKYTFVAGTANDEVELFVNPSLADAEPATPLIKAAVGGTDATAIAAVALRQGSSSPVLVLDAIKMDTAWDKVVLEDNAVPTLVSGTPTNGATNVATTLDIVLQFNESVSAGTGSFTLTPSTGTSLTLPATHEKVVFNGSTVTITNVVLEPNTTYTATVDNNAVKDGVGNFFAGIADNTWSFTTTSTLTPVITAEVTTVEFPAIAINKMSASQSYGLGGTDLVGDITVAVSGPFQIAKRVNAEQNIFGTEPLTFTQAEVDGGEKVYVRFLPTATTGNTGSITHSSTDAENVIVTLTGYAYDPLVQNFDDPNYLTTSGWSQVSVAGDANIWSHTTTGPNSGTGAAVMNGYSEAGPSNDWLISPAMDLTAITGEPTLSFYSREFFTGPNLKLYVSTTYSGNGTIDMTQWTEIEGYFPSETSVWKLSDQINLSAYESENTYVAFVYETTGGGAGLTSEWKIDDFKVEGTTNGSNIPNTYLSFGDVLSGANSASQNFTFSAYGYGDITVTAPTGFQVSLDNTTFTSSVVVPAADAEAGKTVYVQFAPASKALNFSGNLSFTSEMGNLTAIGPLVVGSSYPRTETFDVATYNVEFFASNMRDSNNREFGPTDDPLQIENITKVMKEVNADIFALQEVSEEDALDQVLAEMPGYAKNISQVYSYSIKPSTSPDPFPMQKIGFIYNTATVQPVAPFRVMFKELYEQAVAGTTNLISDSFWSSGRLPYMGIFDVTVDGKKQRVHVVTIHAKSGSDKEDYDRRMADIQVLRDSLNTYYADANLILLGDFNDDVSKSIRTGSPSSYSDFVNDAANYKTLTYELSQNNAFSFPSSNSFLDHILISNELTDEYLNQSVMVADLRQFIPSYSTTTSDHLPVFARFSFEGTPTVSFTESTMTKAEGDGTATITLQVSAASTTAQQVKVLVTRGQNVTSSDYTITPAETDGMISVTIPANETSVTFSVNIADDDDVELTESLSLSIAEVSSQLGVGTANGFTLSITDNDKSTVNFTLASVSRAESTGAYTVNLSLNKAAPVAQTVTVSVTNGTGVTYGANADYTTTPAVQDGTIVITVPAGETTASFEVMPVVDTEVEGNESITFALASVSEMLSIGTGASFTYAIEGPLSIGGELPTVFNVNPNPTLGEVSLQLPVELSQQKNLNLTLLSLRGEKILHSTGAAQALNRELTTKLSTAPAGLYLIRIEAGGKVFQARVVKQ